MQMERPEGPTCIGILRARRLLDTGSRDGSDRGLDLGGKPNVLQVWPLCLVVSQGVWEVCESNDSH